MFFMVYGTSANIVIGNISEKVITVSPLDSEDGSYFCDECDYKDVKTQSNTSFKCDMCECYGRRQSDLKKHIQSTKYRYGDRNNVIYSCDHCDYIVKCKITMT